MCVAVASRQAMLELFVASSVVVIDKFNCWSSPHHESDIINTERVNVSPISSAGEQNWK